MFQYVFLDWELPRTPSFVVCGAWVETDQGSTTLQRGIPAFRKFIWGHIVHNRIYTVLSIFEAIIFLVMPRNVTKLHSSDSSGGRYFNSAMRRLKAL